MESIIIVDIVFVFSNKCSKTFYTCKTYFTITKTLIFAAFYLILLLQWYLFLHLSNVCILTNCFVRFNVFTCVKLLSVILEIKLITITLQQTFNFLTLTLLTALIYFKICCVWLYHSLEKLCNTLKCAIYNSYTIFISK